MFKIIQIVTVPARFRIYKGSTIIDEINAEELQQLRNEIKRAQLMAAYGGPLQKYKDWDGRSPENTQE